jgi:adenine deaminase
MIESVKSTVINRFAIAPKSVSDFVLRSDNPKVRVIEALDGELITNEIFGKALVSRGNLVSNVAEDILKIVVVNRYANAPVAISFIKNFGLKRGALASSVAHDSHNVIAVGVSDEMICKAVNVIIDSKGGVAAVDEAHTYSVALPVGGLMSNEDGYKVVERYMKVDAMSKDFGSKLKSPFMTLSFMALLVIPTLKLSDKGLFDGKRFSFVDPLIK